MKFTAVSRFSKTITYFADNISQTVINTRLYSSATTNGIWTNGSTN